MKRWFLAAFFALFGTGCTAPDRVVEEHLTEKYGEAFAVQSSNFIPGTGAYHLQVSPEANPALTFLVEYSRNTGVVNDFYPQARWHREAHEAFTELVSDASRDIPHRPSHPAHRRPHAGSTEHPDLRRAPGRPHRRAESTLPPLPLRRAVCGGAGGPPRARSRAPWRRPQRSGLHRPLLRPRLPRRPLSRRAIPRFRRPRRRVL